MTPCLAFPIWIKTNVPATVHCMGHRQVIQVGLTAPPHLKPPAEVVLASEQDVSRTNPRRGVWACPTGRRPGVTSGEIMSPAGLAMSWCRPRRAGEPI